MKIQKLQNYKPKDTRKAVPTHYTLLFDAYQQCCMQIRLCRPSPLTEPQKGAVRLVADGEELKNRRSFPEPSEVRSLAPFENPSRVPSGDCLWTSGSDA